MVVQRYSQTSFARGVAGKGLRYNPNSSIFGQSLYDATNMIGTSLGGLEKRPSSRVVATTSGVSKLLKFVSPDGAEWIIELTNDNRARFYTGRAIADGLEQTGLPYSAEEIANVTTVKQKDKIDLLHPRHAPRRLTYASDGKGGVTWTLSTPSMTGEMSGKKPACGATFGQRKVFSGLEGDQGRILFSRTPDINGNDRYDDFTKGTEETDALDLKDERGEAVYWLVERENGILYGTQSGISLLGTRDTSSAFSALNAEVRRQNSLSAGKLAPQEYNQSLLMVGNSLKELNKIQYSFETGGLAASQLSKIAPDLIHAPVKEMAYSQELGIVFLLIDGDLLAYTLHTETGAEGFYPVKMGGDGQINSLTVANAAEGAQLWLSVSRGDVHTIEFIQYGESLSMPHHLDSAVYRETESDTLDGLEHLNGKTVVVVHDRGEREATVSDGEVTLDYTSSAIAAGYAMPASVSFLPPIPAFQQVRTSQGTASIVSCELVVSESAGFQISAIHGDNVQVFSNYTGVHKGGIGTSDFSDDVAEWSPAKSPPVRFPRVEVMATSARPLNIRSVSYTLDVN